MSHIASRSLYYSIFAALMVLTAVTVWVASIDLGWMNTIVAMAIAVLKATLVILYFMHLRYSTRLVRVVLMSGFFWFGIMVVLTLSDYFSRGWLETAGR
jgi:cytochrome c oxidase subunit 4